MPVEQRLDYKLWRILQKANTPLSTKELVQIVNSNVSPPYKAGSVLACTIGLEKMGLLAAIKEKNVIVEGRRIAYFKRWVSIPGKEYDRPASSNKAAFSSTKNARVTRQYVVWQRGEWEHITQPPGPVSVFDLSNWPSIRYVREQTS